MTPRSAQLFYDPAFVLDSCIDAAIRAILSQLRRNITCEMPEFTFSPPPAFATRKSENTV